MCSGSQPKVLIDRSDFSMEVKPGINISYLIIYYRLKDGFTIKCLRNEGMHDFAAFGGVRAAPLTFGVESRTSAIPNSDIESRTSPIPPSLLP